MKCSPLFFLFSLFCFNAFAQQIVVSPLGFDESRNKGAASSKRISSTADTLKLPFFEDFSQTSIHADTSRWMPGSGVYINRQYPVNSPTYNVATFDGLDANGRPYNTGSNLTLEGQADRLTSLPIDLSGIPEGYDSLYLSFYWQAAGKGERPDIGDFINLQFKNTNEVWENIWTQRGDTNAYTNPSQFKYKSIKISQAKFLHKGFQFRFTSHGRLSGNFDVWNLDYVYLDKSRTEQAHLVDIGISALPVSLLKNYCSMPVQQYFAAPEKERGTELTHKVRNMDNDFRLYDDSIFLYQNRTEKIAEHKPQGTFFTGFYRDSVFRWSPPANTIPYSEDPIHLRYFIKGFTGDTIVNNIDFRKNDTASVYTNLSNYYAYDDSTAEFSFGLENEYGGKLAYKFDLNIEDTLTAVDIYFPRINRNLNNYNLRLHVWKKIEPQTTDEEVIYQQMIILKYSNNLNQFQRFILDEPIVLDGTFYIGFEQFTLHQIPVGFDVNTNSSDKIFYQINRTWRKYDKDPGSLMMRPVFRSENLVLSTKKPTKPLEDILSEERKKPAFYPNPTSGTINFREPVQEISVYDLNGKLVHKESFVFGDGQNTNLPYNLPDGMYMLHINDGKTVGVQKILYRK